MWAGQVKSLLQTLSIWKDVGGRKSFHAEKWQREGVGAGKIKLLVCVKTGELLCSKKLQLLHCRQKANAYLDSFDSKRKISVSFDCMLFQLYKFGDLNLNLLCKKEYMEKSHVPCPVFLLRVNRTRN